MVHERASIALPLDSERIISAQLLDHGVIAPGGTLMPDQCRARGRLTGQSIFEHQERLIRNRSSRPG